MKKKIPPWGGISFISLHVLLLKNPFRTGCLSDPTGLADPDRLDGSDPTVAGRASDRRPAAGRASDPGSGSAGPGSGSGSAWGFPFVVDNNAGITRAADNGFANRQVPGRSLRGVNLSRR